MNSVMKRIFFLLLVFTPSLAAADKVWNSGKGATWDCKKDATVIVNASKGTWTFKGACKSITLNGSSIKAKIASADEVTISGAKADVTVAAVGAITVSGAKNKVVWTKALSGDAPTISNTGADNAITQTGAAAPVATNAAAPAAPASGGKSIDCSKSATFIYAENDGSFTFTGKCDKILISGNNNKLKVDSVNAVMLSGNKNVVDAATVSVIDTTGNENAVTYKSRKPKISNTGNGNKISATK